MPKDFADGGNLRLAAPFGRDINIKSLKKTAGGKDAPPPAQGADFSMAGEDEDYYYFMSPHDEFRVLIPQKALDTVETKI